MQHDILPFKVLQTQHSKHRNQDGFHINQNYKKKKKNTPNIYSHEQIWRQEGESTGLPVQSVTINVKEENLLLTSLNVSTNIY